VLSAFVVAEVMVVTVEGVGMPETVAVFSAITVRGSNELREFE
jgi:hypothetical protein